jgi:hypothetical protein
MNNFKPLLLCLNSFGIKLRIDSIKLIALLMVLIPCLMSCDRGEDKKSISESNLPKCSGEIESAWNNCYGEMKSKSGDVYKGEYKDGKYFGKGEFLMSNGDKFLGNWIDGLKNGQGIYTWKEGDIFEGEFKMGQRQGKATYLYFDGRKFIGYYENNKRLNGREYDKNGILIKEWSHGVMSAVSPAEPTANAAKKNTPEFTLACRTGSGQPWYRIVSKNGEIYFASIVNENNIRAAKKSFEIDVQDREINVEMQSGDDETVHYLSLDRSSLYAVLKRFASLELYPPDGFSQMGLNCEPIDDPDLFDVLNQAYESTKTEALEKKREYENRPNKI